MTGTMTVYGYFGTMAETTSKYTRDFFKISDYHTCGRFKPSAKLTIRQILLVGVILVDFFWDANIHSGVDSGATVTFASEVKRCHLFSFILPKTGERIQLEAHCAMQR